MFVQFLDQLLLLPKAPWYESSWRMIVGFLRRKISGTMADWMCKYHVNENNINNGENVAVRI